MMNRRSFLKMSSSALGLAAAPRLLPAAQDEPRRVKGVIWLWMDGGMPQVHTWDPKKGMESGGIGTPVDGLQLSELLPVCASQAQHLSILRTVTHGLGDHAVATAAMHLGVISSGGPEPAPIGTILASELAGKDCVLPKFMTISAPRIPESDHFPEEFRPFALSRVDSPIPNLRRNVDSTRDLERQALLLDQNKGWNTLRQQTAIEKLDWAIVRSGEIMNTPKLSAFNIHAEPEELRQQYGPGFGENCLLARRLVEAGCPFVEIGLGGWAGQWKLLTAQLDRGFGSLVRDLAEKRLLRDVLVVCATEFGRSWNRWGPTAPWHQGFSVVLAGGALVGGRVVGDTGPSGERCKPPVPLKDLFATIYKACGVDPTKTYRVEGRTFKYVDGGTPVADLF